MVDAHRLKHETLFNRFRFRGPSLEAGKTDSDETQWTGAGGER
jgi:hypothetical protein